ncbi:MAG: HAD-IIA family hydrolase [Candidatus Izemoplasmataceae bacterium]
MGMLDSIKWFLLDMDGTLYLDDTLIDGAKEFLKKLDETDRQYIFLTNNSSKNKKAYRHKLSSMGIDVSEERIFTSGEATTIYLKGIKQNANVYLLGNGFLEEEFREEGFTLTNGTDLTPDFVVLGFDTTLTYEKIHKACDHLREGIPFIATHPDLNCPLKDGKYMPDTGSMIKMFEAATNVSPTIIGKPNRRLIDTIVKKYAIDRHTLCMVGDRLYTDIRLAINGNIESILVLSGETKAQDLKDAPIRPSRHYRSVKEIIKDL